MSYDIFKKQFLKFFKNKINFKLIDKDNVEFRSIKKNYKLRYNIKKLFKYKNNIKKINPNLLIYNQNNVLSIFSRNLNYLSKKTNLNNKQLKILFNRSKFYKKKFNNKPKILLIARDSSIKKKNYDIVFTFNSHQIKNISGIEIRIMFPDHVFEILDLIELYRKTNNSNEYLEWFHKSNPLQYDTVEDYINNSREKCLYYGKWLKTYPLTIIPGCFKHKYLHNLIDYYQGPIYFMVSSKINNNIDLIQYKLIDNIGFYFLIHLLKTNSIITVNNFSDDPNDEYSSEKEIRFKNTIIYNIILFLKLVRKI